MSTPDTHSEAIVTRRVLRWHTETILLAVDDETYADAPLAAGDDAAVHGGPEGSPYVVLSDVPDDDAAPGSDSEVTAVRLLAPDDASPRSDRADLDDAIREARAALDGDSNDAEHDALYALLSVVLRDFSAPLPTYSA